VLGVGGTSAEWKPTPANQEVLKKHIVQFLTLSTGGPAAYDGKDMKDAHAGLKITNPEFDATIGDMKASLDAFGVPVAEQKELPSFIGKLHSRFATPYTSILVTSAIMLLMTLKSSFVAALTISAIARLVTYAATCLALPLLRQRQNTPKALFHLPFGIVIAGLSLVLIVWLLANSTRQEAITAAIVAAVGLLIYFAHRLYSRSS